MKKQLTHFIAQLLATLIIFQSCGTLNLNSEHRTRTESHQKEKNKHQEYKTKEGYTVSFDEENKSANVQYNLPGGHCEKDLPFFIAKDFSLKNINLGNCTNFIHLRKNNSNESIVLVSPMKLYGGAPTGLEGDIKKCIAGKGGGNQIKDTIIYCMNNYSSSGNNNSTSGSGRSGVKSGYGSCDDSQQFHATMIDIKEYLLKKIESDLVELQKGNEKYITNKLISELVGDAERMWDISKDNSGYKHLTSSFIRETFQTVHKKLKAIISDIEAEKRQAKEQRRQENEKKKRDEVEFQEILKKPLIEINNYETYRTLHDEKKNELSETLSFFVNSNNPDDIGKIKNTLTVLRTEVEILDKTPTSLLHMYRGIENFSLLKEAQTKNNRLKEFLKAENTIRKNSITQIEELKNANEKNIRNFLEPLEKLSISEEKLNYIMKTSTDMDEANNSLYKSLKTMKLNEDEDELPFFDLLTKDKNKVKSFFQITENRKNILANEIKKIKGIDLNICMKKDIIELLTKKEEEKSHNFNMKNSNTFEHKSINNLQENLDKFLSNLEVINSTNYNNLSAEEEKYFVERLLTPKDLKKTIKKILPTKLQHNYVKDENQLIKDLLIVENQKSKEEKQQHIEVQKILNQLHATYLEELNLKKGRNSIDIEAIHKSQNVKAYLLNQLEKINQKKISSTQNLNDSKKKLINKLIQKESNKFLYEEDLKKKKSPLINKFFQEDNELLEKLNSNIKRVEKSSNIVEDQIKNLLDKDNSSKQLVTLLEHQKDLFIKYNTIFEERKDLLQGMDIDSIEKDSFIEKQSENIPSYIEETLENESIEKSRLKEELRLFWKIYGHEQLGTVAN